MKRREFIAAVGTAAAAWPLTARGQLPAPSTNITTVRQDWLDRRKEPILEPDLPIFDPHHHLWIRPGWRYLVDELLADTNSGHNIAATVYVQARSMYRETGPVEMRPVGETEFVNGVAAMFASGLLGWTRACAGIVGQADLRLGSRVEPVLTAHLRAGGDRFRGIRHITSWDADASINNPDYPSPPKLMGDRTFREGFALLSRFGLSFDAQLYHPQIDELADLARSFPDVKIVLNHTGVPLGIGAYRAQRNEVFSRWATSIKALAAHPNVHVKIGGLGMRYNGFGFNEQAEPPSSEMVAATCRPYVETCIDAFGTSRSMFESNFPVDKVSYSYQVFWNACKLMVKGASGTEKADLFAGTATRFYRLSMKVYDLKAADGRIVAFEIGNGAIGRRGVCRVVARIPGATLLRQPVRVLSWFRESTFCEFDLEGVRFSADEGPWGDDSRYCIGPEPPRWVPQLEKIREAFLEHQTYVDRPWQLLLARTLLVGAVVTVVWMLWAGR